MEELSLEKKYAKYVAFVPAEFAELSKIDLGQLSKDAELLPEEEKERLRNLAKILGQLETLKQISGALLSSHVSPENHSNLRYGLFYQDWIPLMIFNELWSLGEQSTFKKWEELKGGNGALASVARILQGQSFNRVRNAVAHVDLEFDFEAGELILRHYGKESSRVKLMELSRLASVLSLLVQFMVPSSSGEG